MVTSLSRRAYPWWCWLSLGINGVVAIATMWWLRPQAPETLTAAMVSPGDLSLLPVMAGSDRNPTRGERQYLNYQQWRELLEQEATAIGEQNPPHLQILLGDSISLWFPPALLPPQKTWLNQGISGDTTKGVLHRLHFLDTLAPERIYLMIGINDLLKGVGEDTVIANQTLIIQTLKRKHPHSELVIFSILPHQGEAATWEGKAKFQSVPNHVITRINRRLAQVAAREGVFFFDLYPLFADSSNHLQGHLSTDGLHLSPQGYQLWGFALQIFDQVQVPHSPPD